MDKDKKEPVYEEEDCPNMNCEGGQLKIWGPNSKEYVYIRCGTCGGSGKVKVRVS